MSSIHLLRTAMGTRSLDHLSEIQQSFRTMFEGRSVPFLSTKRRIRRVNDLVNGGSVFWIVKHVISARQAVIGFEEGMYEGHKRTWIYLDDPIIRVAPIPHRAIQGWRYFDPAKAPSDLGALHTGEGDELPEQMAAQLREAGLL